MGTGREEHSTGGRRCLPEFGRSWLPLAAVALCLAVAVGYCVAKRGFFVDEVWSYGYANSHYARVLSDVVGGDLAGATLTRRDLLDYVSVGEGERMDVGSVLHNQAPDLHPPLFGLALNAASSLAPGTWSKWAGLGLNLACHAVALVALWALLRELGCSPAASACGVALWGLSRAGLSDVLYIRMYEMLTALTVLLALELAALMRGGASGGARRLLPAAVGATVFLGLMTQYYFAIYAFLACLAAGTHLLRRRRLGEAGALAACALAGVGLFLLAWPAALTNLPAGRNPSIAMSGEGAFYALLNVPAWPERLSTFGKMVIQALPAVILVWLLSVWGTIRSKRETHTEDSAFEDTLLTSHIRSIILPAFLYLLIIALIALFEEPRFIYNVCPLISAAAAVSLDAWFRSMPQETRSRQIKVVIGALTAVLLIFAIFYKPAYLGEEAYAQQEAVVPYAADPCVYIVGRGKTTDSANLSITADVPQLLEFEDVHVETDPASAGIASYLASKGDPDEVVLYVDTVTYLNHVNYGGTASLDSEAISDLVAKRLGYSRKTLIKRVGSDAPVLSEAYLLRR